MNVPTRMARGRSRELVTIAVVTAFVLLASGRAHAASRGLVGAWFGTASFELGDVPLGSVKSLLTFTADGNVIEGHRPYLAPPAPFDAVFGNLLVSSGHGRWERTGPNQYAATIMYIYQGAPDNPTQAGAELLIQTIRLRLKIGRDGSTLSGTLVDQLALLDGTPIISASGEVTASRIAVQPLR